MFTHDQNNVVEHNETTNVGNDRTENIGNDETISIGHDRTERVENDETISIGHDQSNTIGNDQNNEIIRNRISQTTLDTHNLIACFQPPILKISLNLEQYWIPIIKSSEKPEDADQHKNRISSIFQKRGRLVHQPVQNLCRATGRFYNTDNYSKPSSTSFHAILIFSRL